MTIVSQCAAERLVDRVVDDLADQVVQPALVGAADVHAGTAANRLQPFQDLDVATAVVSRRAGRRLWPTCRGLVAMRLNVS